jgi:hypothetical protein
MLRLKHIHSRTFTCECDSPKHKLVIVINPGNQENPPSLYMKSEYIPRSFLVRCWEGLKYIFCKKAPHQNLNHFIWSSFEVFRAIELFKDYEVLYNNYLEMELRGYHD